jgi:hypothetical protein
LQERASFSRYAIDLNLEPPQETRLEAACGRRRAAMSALPPQVDIDTGRALAPT